MFRFSIEKTDAVKPFLNKEVGSVKINQSWVHHNNSYECAAWWEDSKIEEGVYPLILKSSTYHPNELYLSAELKSIVVDDFFPALWGGVAIGNKPYKSSNLGQVRKVFHRVDLVEAVDRTGNIPGSNMDYFVNPFMFPVFIEAAKTTLLRIQQHFTKSWSNELNNLNTIKYCGENMAGLADAIEKMEGRLKSFTTASDYMLNNYISNTTWAA